MPTVQRQQALRYRAFLCAMLMSISTMICTPIPSAAQIGPGTFTDPGYGWSVSWDTAIWSSVSSSSASSSLTLETPFSRLDMLANESSGEDPPACIDGLARAYDVQVSEGSITRYAPFPDDNGEPIAGANSDRAFAAYELTFPAEDSEYALVTYAECRSLAVDGVLLRILHTTVPEAYPDEALLAADVLASIEITGTASSDVAIERDRTPSEKVFSDTDAGWSVTWDTEIWEADVATGFDLRLYNGSTTLLFVPVDDYDDDVDACLDAFISGLETDPQVTDIVTLPDNDELMTGSDDIATAVIGLTYTASGGEKVERFNVLRCVALDDAVLFSNSIGPLATFDSELDAIITVLDTVHVMEPDPSAEQAADSETFSSNTPSASPAAARTDH